MKIGRHKMHNRFPRILHYIIPRSLLTPHTEKEVGYKQYKWLWFYIVI